MQLPGRGYIGNTYRFGFNGQEKDDEISGNGNSNTAEFWQYDTRLGRRWNIDPKPNPSLSNYACFANNPIFLADPGGDTIRLPKPSILNREWNMMVYGDISRLLKGEYGRALIKNLHTSKVNIYLHDVVFVTGSETYGDHPNIWYADKGSVTVEYDGNSDVKVDNVASHSFLVLVHEFVHARDVANGYFKQFDKGGKLAHLKINKREIAEIRAVIYQNIVAKEQGLTEIRTEYNGKSLLKEDGITPIKDYGFDVTEGLFNGVKKPETKN